MTNHQEKDAIQNTEFERSNDLNKYQLLVERLVRIKETIMYLEKTQYIKRVLLLL